KIQRPARTGVPEDHRLRDERQRRFKVNTVLAIANVTIKELYRRKDFYVLFVLSALITLMAGSASFFNDTSVVRYLKELCLLLIWVSALVIAVTTAARQIPAE